MPISAIPPATRPPQAVRRYPVRKRRTGWPARLLGGLVLLAGVFLVACWVQPAHPLSALTPVPPSATPPVVEVDAARAESTEAPTWKPVLASVPLSVQTTLESALSGVSQHYGVVVEDLDQGQRFGFEDQRLFESASVYKLGVATEVLRQVDAGHLSLADSVTVVPDDAVEPEPAGGLDVGDTVTVQNALRVMLSVSSNAAAHALLRTLGRPEYNAAVAQLGLTHTRVPLELGDEPHILPDWASGEEDVAVTTPADTALLLRLLATGQVLSPRSQDLLYALMRVPGEPRPVEASLPSSAIVEAKAGNLDRASNVAALVTSGDTTFSVAVFDEDVDPGDARLVIGQIARAVYAYYVGAPTPEPDTPNGTNTW